jgi:hypothetical protein
MEAFIKSYQYNFIKKQTQILINGHSSVNDMDVLNTLKAIAKEKVLNLFIDISDEQKRLLNPVHKVEDKADAEKFLSELKPYVIPFKQLTEQILKKLFPKAKKLKLPSLENVDLKEITYLGWEDKGSNKKYIVTDYQNKLIGLQGSFRYVNKKGICALCNGLEELGMFLSEKKGTGIDTFIKRGNYICQDSLKCNQNLTTGDKLGEFIMGLSK